MKVKYLHTLERFIDPLYTGNAETITDALPALMNSIKMIHTIARYYNTSERMTSLFMKVAYSYWQKWDRFRNLSTTVPVLMALFVRLRNKWFSTVSLTSLAIMSGKKSSFAPFWNEDGLILLLFLVRAFGIVIHRF
jgi:hypothetical protein